MPDRDHPDDLDDLRELQALLGDPEATRGEIAHELLELDKIPRRLWEQALTPVHAQVRCYVARQVQDEQLGELAWALVEELNHADRVARHSRDVARGMARRTGAPLPVPKAEHAAAQPTAQLNMRLRRDDYARLREAATAVGMKPTTLARALVLNGVNKVLADMGAAKAAAQPADRQAGSAT